MTFTSKMLTDLAYFFTNTDRSALEQAGIIKPSKSGDDKWKRYNHNFDIFILKSDEQQLTALAKLVNDYVSSFSPPPSSHLPVTAEEHNAAFDPANDALGGAFKDGFREGWLFAKDPGFEDRQELEEDYPRVVDIAPSECWDAYRSHYFAMLPLAAIPEVGTPPPAPNSLPADERVLELLKDPAAVLVNWLRGSINLDSVIERMRSEGTIPPSCHAAGSTLDERMKAADMFTIEEMMGITPLTKWKVQVGMTDLDIFSEWLDRKVSEYLTMKAAYDLGDKDESDELYEWVLAHAGAYSSIRENFRAARAALADTPPQDSLVGLTADQLCTTPLIEDLVPTSEEWEACEVIKDRYELMKRRVRLAFARAATTEGSDNGQA